MQAAVERERAPEGAEVGFERELEAAFKPLHKRCLGMAVGAVLALAVLVLTFAHMLRSADVDEPLVLLAQYFFGYSVSPLGALVGALWGFWVGFVLGWFFAFCRNVTLAGAAIFLRARAELVESKGFLDHI